MRKILKYVYWSAGILCLGYYFLLGHSSRFGLDMSWIWLVGGAIFGLAGAACLLKGIPGWIRVAWRVLVCAGLILVLTLEGFVIRGMTQTPPKGLDYLIVLGARVEADGPSPALRRRINATLDYLSENPETWIIASGGQGADEPTTEAECIRNELVAAGIPADRILMENQSTTTAENLQFSKALIAPSDASVGLVTNNFHIFRATRLAAKAGIQDVHGLAAEYTGFTLPHYMIREAACTIADFFLGNL